MEKIDTTQFITVAELRETLGSSIRAAWRAIDRVGRDKCVIKFLGRTLVRKSMIKELREHYYPYYSDAHHAKVKEWGAAGGTAKARNAAKAARLAKREEALAAAKAVEKKKSKKAAAQ